VEHGCEWYAKGCAHAADTQGHVEVAQWARAQPVLDDIDDNGSGGGHMSSEEEEEEEEEEEDADEQTV